MSSRPRAALAPRSTAPSTSSSGARSETTQRRQRLGLSAGQTLQHLGELGLRHRIVGARREARAQNARRPREVVRAAALRGAVEAGDAGRAAGSRDGEREDARGARLERHGALRERTRPGKRANDLARRGRRAPARKLPIGARDALRRGDQDRLRRRLVTAVGEEAARPRVPRPAHPRHQPQHPEP
jgi:hypothetical protein